MRCILTDIPETAKLFQKCAGGLWHGRRADLLHFLYSLFLPQRLPHLLGGDGQRHDPHANGIIDGVGYRGGHGKNGRFADTTGTEWPFLIGYLYDEWFDGWEVEA